MTKIRPLTEAHLPTWLTIRLGELRQNKYSKLASYALVGWEIGTYHLDDFCDPENFTDEQWESLCSDESMHQPTKALRRIFSSERHPNGIYGLVDYIPPNQRRAFLLGVLLGEAGEDVEVLRDTMWQERHKQ